MPLMQWLGHEAKKRLYAEEAPTNCGSRGQLSTTNVVITEQHTPTYKNKIDKGFGIHGMQDIIILASSNIEYATYGEP
ncbi:hypothetical protein V1477_004308 [Vespula maculifrons]|uniref:Uncharacterized protein n=1 Tax=Vespula maculifrons TaxID=7453 RepID=A0ABD2CRK8_VESMC